VGLIGGLRVLELFSKFSKFVKFPIMVLIAVINVFFSHSESCQNIFLASSSKCWKHV